MGACACGTPSLAAWHYSAVVTRYPYRHLGDYQATETMEWDCYRCADHPLDRADHDAVFDAGITEWEVSEWVETFLLTSSCLTDWERN